MEFLKKSIKLSYFTLILLLALIFTQSACKNKQSPPSEEETQSNLTELDKQPQIQQMTPEEAIQLRILYVGLSNTDRQKDFVSFLSKNFKEVKTIDLYTFKEEQTKESDVVILDKDGIQWGSKGGKPLRDLRVSDQYSRPTISLGIPGAFWTDRMRLKTGYM
ncbi:MAG: hypothetical protein JW715_11260 [Sedimentisphaerales bacterium]|nr:hypothetical protein [Sedimentisphaerales bacterium]